VDIFDCRKYVLVLFQNGLSKMGFPKRAFQNGLSKMGWSRLLTAIKAWGVLVF
jgi:hypothetical protein